MNHALHDPNVLANRLLTRAWNRDGLPEIGIGLSFLFFSALTYAQEVLPRRSAGQVAAVLAFAVGCPVLCFSLRPLLKRVRSRWLAAREGHVEYLPFRPKKYLRPLAAMAVILPLGMFVLSHSERLVLPATGLLGALIFGAAGWSGRMTRFLACAAIMLATSIWLALSSIPEMIGLAILFGSQGLLLLIAGAAVFWRFLAEPREGADER